MFAALQRYRAGSLKKALANFLKSQYYKQAQAKWFRSQGAKAIDCNSVTASSNLAGTSIWGYGEIGRRNGLKIR